MAHDDQTGGVIPRSSAGINEALVVVRGVEAGALPSRTDIMSDDGERVGDEAGRFDGPEREDG
jgi:hypothetical protein